MPASTAAGTLNDHDACCKNADTHDFAK